MSPTWIAVGFQVLVSVATLAYLVGVLNSKMDSMIQRQNTVNGRLTDHGHALDDHESRISYMKGQFDKP
jgi:hypothetical protein